MRIGEVAEITGLSISNIRFYEKKGLITPDRNEESKYREYTKEDVERLKTIILYRKMNLSIENICLLMDGKTDVVKVLKKQTAELEQKKEMLQGSIELCQKVLSDTDHKNLDVDYYLNYVKEEESKGVRFAEIDELLDDIGTFTKLSWFQSDPHVGWIFSNKWIYRLVILAVIFLWIGLPILALVESYMEDGNLSVGALFFWICWLVGFGIAFLRYRQVSRR